MTPATFDAKRAGEIVLSGSWTARGVGQLDRQVRTASAGSVEVTIDGAAVDALDTVGVWVLRRLLEHLRAGGARPRLARFQPQHAKLVELVIQHDAAQPPAPARRPLLQRIGHRAVDALQQGFALLSFVGETALALGRSLAHPGRLRWRPILHNLQSSGFSALPIVGLLSFLIGIVVAYQGAEQLRRYGANIFVADLIGLSMLREFAPLITAIIVAGRSGSAYAAQIGTMAVTEEIDAMRTLGIPPLDLLVLPKILALSIALPLLTVYADILGVAGGMVMARAQLGVGYGEFLDRMVLAVDVSAYLTGVGKAPVFAAIIALVGCFQGFLTQGGADSVGRQTTRAVVQSIFLVVVADALFSVLFSMLDL
jgi:phospholipid/cholesterol/gamma-HCH transport system permease protein